MDGYWWQCSCGNKTKCLQGLEGAVPAHLRRIIDSGFDQRLLKQDCPKCKGLKSMRITFEFPKNPTGKLQLLHMVGLVWEDTEYVPMLWEMTPLDNPAKKMFEFNYMTGRNPRGLKTAAVLSLGDIRTLLELYKEKTGKPLPFAFAKAAAAR